MKDRMSAWGIAGHVVLLVSWSAQDVQADPADLCLAAGVQSAQARQIPPAVMTAITLTETGRGSPARPWPWAINLSGQGHWFATRQEALAFAQAAVSSGHRNFDVGCFQLNYRWHGSQFKELSQMFDPQSNADYAADFLTSLFAEVGDWSEAAGRYHSRTPEHAARYRSIFDEHYAVSADHPGPAISIAPETRENWFPLLVHSGSAGQLGSLVSLGAGG